MNFQDIQLTDVELRNQFVNYFMSGNYQSALDILSNNPQLDYKAFTADVLNTIGNSLLALENYYYNNVENYLMAELERFNTIMSQFYQRSAWNVSTIYSVNNFVIYNYEVYMYINSTSSSGNLPTDTNYWVYVGLRGQQGADGLDINLRYAWSSASAYNTKDIVYYQDVLYVAKQPSLNQVPSNTSDYWAVFIEIPRAKIIVSRMPVSKPYDGLIWWRIVGESMTFDEVDNKNVTFQDVDDYNYTWGFISEGGW